MIKNKPNPRTRRDLINTFYYYGFISKLSPPRQIIIDGESNIMRFAILTYEDKIGKRKSELFVSLPNIFDHKRLVLMQKHKVCAKFLFCLKMRKCKDVYRNTAFCLSVEPIEKKYAHLRQEIHYDPYLTHRKYRVQKQKVDKEGYVYPYEY